MATNEEVLAVVSEMALDVGELKTGVAVINERLKIIDEHKETLYGKNGLKPRVQSLEDAKAAEDKHTGENMASVRSVVEKVVTVAIIMFFTWLLFLYKKNGG